MDLLCNAYSTNSDDEPQSEPKSKTISRNPLFPPSKRPRPEFSDPLTEPRSVPLPNQLYSSLHNETPVAGRYISKRERALSGSIVPTVPEPGPSQNPTVTKPVLGSISESDIPHDILSSLRYRPKGRVQQSRLSGRLFAALCCHTKAVNTIQWSPTHAHLLASAGMDHSICIWNVWSRHQKLARAFSFHNAAVNDVKWSPQGLFVLSCGYDSSLRLIDVEKGIETQNFKEEQVIRVIKFHPDNPNLFLSGGSKGSIRLWDIRRGKVVHEYIRGLGPILDVEFTINGKQFISSSDVSGVNMSENSVIVWDISREVPLSNQVYVEAYTCPCIRHHPFDPYFVAQSNGNYIAIFSSSPPFRLDKYRRYENHVVSGFPIKCNFSLDGEKLVSGSSDGSIYIYNCRSTKLDRKIKAYEQACIDVAIHPILPDIIASCNWHGDISVFE
ncbi:hypothetical protein Pint_04350 [Pistacia integerrima]|uniref:Uncharacterized protein n=1 Tax=Pistacia integerrima TaxID=434235 RepID=A0ACC0Z9J8_9ROSI|nr:hypothetical protein Pint_04350 [Pistacia integerrima]